MNGLESIGKLPKKLILGLRGIIIFITLYRFTNSSRQSCPMHLIRGTSVLIIFP